MAKESWGAYIRRTRREWGLTQEQFGYLCGFSAKYISVIEREEQYPPAHTEAKIESVLSAGREAAQAKLRQISQQGKGLAPKNLPREKTSSVLPPSTDCTSLIHALAKSDLNITLEEFLFLLEAQLALPSAISATLAHELLKNRRAQNRKQ